MKRTLAAMVLSLPFATIPHWVQAESVSYVVVDDSAWDMSTVKKFGDYTVIQSYPEGSGRYVGKMANVPLKGTRYALSLHASEATGWLTYDVNGSDVTLIVDGHILTDSQLGEKEMSLIKNASDMGVIYNKKVYKVSTKGSGATIIYLNDFPRWTAHIK